MHNDDIEVRGLKDSEVLLAVVYYDADNDEISFKFKDGDKELKWPVIKRFIRVPEGTLLKGQP